MTSWWNVYCLGGFEEEHAVQDDSAESLVLSSVLAIADKFSHVGSKKDGIIIIVIVVVIAF